MAVATPIVFPGASNVTTARTWNDCSVLSSNQERGFQKGRK